MLAACCLLTPLVYYVILFYLIDTSFIPMYVNCSIFYILYISCTVYIWDFMHMYFVRNDEIKMFNQLKKTWTLWKDNFWLFFIFPQFSGHNNTQPSRIYNTCHNSRQYFYNFKSKLCISNKGASKIFVFQIYLKYYKYYIDSFMPLYTVWLAIRLKLYQL